MHQQNAKNLPPLNKGLPVLAVGILLLLFVASQAGAWPARGQAGLYQTIPTPDPFEPDNTCPQATATLVVDGPRQFHWFHTLDDVDSVKFAAVSGERYFIDAIPSRTAASSGLDTFLWLYDASGKRLFSFNDDRVLGDPTAGSRIRWTALLGGTFCAQAVPENLPDDTGYYFAVSRCYDFTENWRVSVDDVLVVANAWRKQATDPDWGDVQQFDTAPDGVINILDITKVTTQLGERCFGTRSR